VTQRITVIANRDAGGSRPAGEIEGVLRGRGIEAVVREVPAGKIRETAEQLAREEPVVGVAGGDGTVNSVASGVIGTDAALAVLPLGTLNHFAQDIGVGEGLEAAADAIAGANIRTVDVGEVNDRIFLNNSSIGLYPMAVRERERRQSRGIGKWPAMAMSLAGSIRRYHLLDLELELEGARRRCRTPVILVSNNRYEIGLPEPVRRTRLDAGELCLYAAHDPGRGRLLLLGVAAAMGRLDHQPEVDVECLAELTVHAHVPLLPVALDGEPYDLRPPLHYRVLPQALRVVAPPAS
jgi:diacylglycerol kinase family enzyme